MTTRTPPVELSGPLRLIRWVTLAVAAAYLVNAAWWGFARTIPEIGWIPVVGGVLALGGLFFISRLEIPIWVIALTTLAIGIVWGFLSQGIPASDFATFYELSAGFADGQGARALWESKSPATTLYFGTAMTIGGTSVATTRIAGTIALALTVLATGKALEYVGFAGRPSRLAALIIGLSPGLIGYSPTVSSEIVLLATTTGGLAWFARTRRRKSGVWGYAPAGLLLSLSYLAVPIGAFYAIGAALVACADVLRRNASRGALIVLLGTLAVAPAAQVAMNVYFDDSWSVSARKHTGLGFLNGTSVICNGRTCPQDLDLARLDANGDQLPLDIANERAVEIALDRWRTDPIGLLTFGLTSKVAQVWRDETHPLDWYMRESPRLEPWTENGAYPAIRTIVDGYYLALILAIPASVAAILLRRVRLPGEAVAVAFGLILSASMYVVMVVQQRYHFSFLPAVAWLVAVAAATVVPRQTTPEESPFESSVPTS